MYDEDSLSDKGVYYVHSDGENGPPYGESHDNKGLVVTGYDGGTIIGGYGRSIDRGYNNGSNNGQRNGDDFYDNGGQLDVYNIFHKDSYNNDSYDDGYNDSYDDSYDNIFDSASSSGVQCLLIHLHSILGLPLPPPKLS